MATQPVAPINLNLQARLAAPQIWSTPPISNNAGTVIDFTAWSALSVVFEQGVSTPLQANQYLSVAGTSVSGANTGIITFETPAAGFAGASPGSVNVKVLGVYASGDTPQLLASGTVSIGQ